MSHVAKKHSSHGALGRKCLLANDQMILITFHSDDSAWMVLGAQACCWMKLICADKLENIAATLEIKEIR